MAVAGSVDVALDIFGGLVTDMAPADLPAGVSPDCQDVAFIPGSVKTRPGLLSIFSPIGGTPAVNYLKTYVPPSGLLRLLALDAAGSLWKESSVGVLSLISGGIVPSSFGKSTSLFTREYLAIGDGKNGIDIPRQFDDTNFDRVSQVGPGLAPDPTDDQAVFSLVASPNGAFGGTNNTFNIVSSPQGLTQVGFLVTVIVSSAFGFTGSKVGDSIIVAGAGVAGYNGTWVLTAVLNAITAQYLASTSGLAASGGGTVKTDTVNYFSTGGFPTILPGTSILVAGVGVAGYNGTWVVRSAEPASNQIDVHIPGANAFAASGGGTVTPIGNIPAGVHQISVIFKTRQGYLTPPAPPKTWTAAGAKRVFVANIPTGPPNVVARILLFTLAGQAFFFYSSGIIGVSNSNFIISDNTTSSVTVDFTDAGLASEISADYLFKLIELGECAGVIDYGSRLFWWGERNKVQNALNLTFDGGFGGSVTNFPFGWVKDATNYGGGGIGNAQVWGQSYNIIGDGATAIRGKMTQGMYQDANGVPIIQSNTAYSIRARIANAGGPAFAQGTLHLSMQSTSGAFTTIGISLVGSTFGATFTEYTAAILPAQTSVPSDLVLQVYMDGTPTFGSQLNIDCIEIFPTNQPFNSSLVRASLVEDPESYDDVTGFLSVNENDGFAVRSAFVLRENLYFVKEHGIYVTQDDGTNEPNDWKITEVSRKIGTLSVNGVAVGEDWAVIADRGGLYITDGGEPKKISQEIQPTWDRINWQFGYKIWVQVDVKNRRILVGIPLDGATAPNKILLMDYRGTNTVAELMDSGPIHTTYTGKLIVLEKSRKWSPWTIIANSGAIVERFDGTQQVFLGNGAGNGKIYQLSDSQLGTDDGAAIPSYYQTYFHYSHELEQAFQIGSHNKLFNYMSQFVEGNGNLVVSVVPPGASPITIASLVLANPALRDVELPINVTAVRAAFKLSTSNLGEWFRLARFIVNAIKHPSAPVRGWN